jgi:predicted permease
MARGKAAPENRPARKGRAPRASARFLRPLAAVRSDLGYSLRGIVRDPGFAAAVILTLALGIAANATMFGIIDRLLLRPPAHVTEPESVVRLGFQQRNASTGEITTSTATSYPVYRELRENVAGFAELGVVGPPGDASLGRGLEAEIVRRSAASASFFRVLGVRPEAGRFFLEEEDVPPAGQPVAVISHGLWQRRFGGDPAAVGQSIDLDNQSYLIVGVAPRGFLGTSLLNTDVWVPITHLGALRWAGASFLEVDWWEFQGFSWLQPVARVRLDVDPGVAAEQATAVHSALLPDQYAADPDRAVVLGPVIAARGTGFSLSESQRRAVTISLWLLGVAGIVLLIACANVANLLLSRTLRRRRELGVRLAIGVSRGRLAGQIFTEVLLLAALGGAVGLFLTAWGAPLAREVLLPGIEWQDSVVSTRMLLFSFGVITAAALLAALAPAMLASRMHASSLLRQGGGRAGTYRRSSLRGGLVLAQAALCVLLLVGAGLFVRSLQNVHAVELGFDVNQLVRVSWNSSALAMDGPDRAALYERAAEGVERLPQVASTSLAYGTSPFWMNMVTTITVPGLDSIPVTSGGGTYPYHAFVGPEHFRTLGTRIVQGRGFDAADATDGGASVALVSRSMAETLWPRENAIGKCFRMGGTDSSICHEVIGVFEDTRVVNVDGDPPMLYYLPLRGSNRAESTLFVRTTGDASAALPAIRQELQALGAELPAPSLTLIRDSIEPQLRPWRVGAVLFSAFGAVALVLAMLGLYAVIAYDVGQRRQELGVRLALGSPIGRLVRMVVGDAARLAAAGVVVGLAVALLFAGRLEPLLFGVAPRDPFVYVTVAVLLILVALCAAALPARRASLVNPNEALKAE